MWGTTHPSSYEFPRSHQKRGLYGGLTATARSTVLKTVGTASNRLGIDTSARRQCTPFVMFTFVRILVMLDLLSLWKTIGLQAVFFGRGAFIWSSTQEAEGAPLLRE